jgi:hypothetical protein
MVSRIGITFVHTRSWVNLPLRVGVPAETTCPLSFMQVQLCKSQFQIKSSVPD